MMAKDVRDPAIIISQFFGDGRSDQKLQSDAFLFVLLHPAAELNGFNR